MGIAAVDSPSPPTDEMTRLEGADVAVGLARSVERLDVMLERVVVGVRGGSDGVRRPYLGSAACQFHAQYDTSQNWAQGRI